MEKEFLETNKKVIRRLNVVNGQINGVKQMIEDERNCEEILIQISAINKVLKSVGNELIKKHLASSVVKEKKEIDNIVDLFEKLHK